MTCVDVHAVSSKARDRFGCLVGELHDGESIVGGNIKFHRKRSDSTGMTQVIAPASNDGFLVGISLVGGHRRRIFNEHHSIEHDFPKNALYVRDYSEEYKADLSGNFDFVLMEISNPAFEQIAEGADLRVGELSRLVGQPDPALSGLVNALFSPAGHAVEKSFLFIDQLSVAIGIHVLSTYGNGRVKSGTGRPGLSQRDEDRAKQLLLSRIDGEISIAELASECRLSRAAFLRAFRETTGRTPHQWLMQQRIEIARKLLRDSDKALGEISKTCGFSSPSHFSRAFLSATGTTPGLWRRG